MCFHSLFDGLNCRSSRRRTERPLTRRLALETLEGRAVPASLSVGDTFLSEGNDSAQNAAVVVSLDAPSARTVMVNYNTANGTAVAGSDYNAVSGKLTFAPGQTSQPILVPIRGDRLAEVNENFFVNLSSARHAKIADAQGRVTIMDDEPRLSIMTVLQYEGNSGTTPFVFTVTLPAAFDEVVTVNYATADGTATTAGNDYVATSGTLTFAPGETTKTITVEVVGDITDFSDETFFVNLSGASNSGLLDVQGTGFIVDDEIPPQPPPPDDGGCNPDNPYYPNC